MKGVIFTLLLFYSVLSFSQTSLEKGLASINKQDAEAYIGLLASDSLQGREAGQIGGMMAAEYLRSVYEKIGVKPWRGQYFQPFSGSMFGGASHENPNMRNVLGYIAGKNSNGAVVIGAHYDHLGIRPTNTNDSIYNGADDNASGVSAVLQVAKAFIESGEKPERTVVFALWDGEEKGLLGSKFFVDDHFSYIPIPANSPILIKGYINCDMIGRNKKGREPSHVAIFTSDNKPVFKEWVQEGIKNHGLILSPEFRSRDEMSGGSDHASFNNKGVPYIFYCTDIHPDYHRVTDSAEKINYDKVTEIAKSAFLNLWKMANIKDF